MMCKDYFLLLVIVRFICSGRSEIINTKVVRKIDLETHLVKVTAQVTIKNLGPTSADEFIYSLDLGAHEYYIKFRNEKYEDLVCEKINTENEAQHIFKVNLDKTLLTNEEYNVKIQIVYIGQIIPLYKTIAFTQDHFVAYTGNVFYFSPYKTVSSETSYIWKNVRDLQLSHWPHRRQGNNHITYVHKNLKPFSFETGRMEFKNNNPFFVVTELERIIDVSHFGKICIEDRVRIKNEGSKMVGPYEQKSSATEEGASGWWYTHLPAAVNEVQYYDTIGNSSKSILLNFKKYKTFKFKPRYPLLRGWKTFYIIKYCVPTYEYLYHDLKGQFVLKIRVVDHILNDVVIKKALVKVLLPEAGEISKVHVPFGFERLKNEKTYTGLCTFGRPTIVVNGSNILENHIASITVEYLFPGSYLIRAPLMLIAYLQSVFVFAILISHVKD